MFFLPKPRVRCLLDASTSLLDAGIIFVLICKYLGFLCLLDLFSFFSPSLGTIDCHIIYTYIHRYLLYYTPDEWIGSTKRVEFLRCQDILAHTFYAYHAIMYVYTTMYQWKINLFYPCVFHMSVLNNIALFFRNYTMYIMIMECVILIV